MALWNFTIFCTALAVLSPQCVANNRWWEAYFADMESSDTDSASVPWWEEYRWWETTEDEDDMEWDERSDRLIAGGDLSGTGVCSRQVVETKYYYENVTYPCWEWIIVPCSSNYNNGRRNRRVKRGSGRSSHICYSYTCETCTKRVRRCGYETVTEKYCCQGYQENGNGGCSMSIQCGNNNGGCSQLCKTDGQDHMCKCFPGFELVNGTQCVDRNECANGMAGCNQYCKNSVGSFYCGCQSGFSLMGPNICEDIDECSLGNGGCEHNCVNTHGGFYCECEAGYQLEKGYMCEDVNECEIFNGSCSHECENLDGTYKCHCPEEMQLFLGNDLRTCMPLEEPLSKSTLEPGATEFLPTDLPLVNTANNEEVKSGVNGALVGGIVGAVIGLGLLSLVAVALAKYFGVPCFCAGAGAGAAAGGGAADNFYETPTVVATVPEKKGFVDAGKGPGYTDLTAFDNNVYGRRIEAILGVTPEPPAYSEADPVDQESPYSDVAPPMYDNIGSVAAQVPSAPVVYDNLESAPIEYDNYLKATDDDNKKEGAFENKTYEQVVGVSAGDIIHAKNCLKSTGTKLS